MPDPHRTATATVRTRRGGARLYELFGDTPQWGDSLRPFLWTHVSTMVTAFTGSTVVDLPVTCTYDFEVAASKYLHGLDDGVVHLALCFSGSSFAVEDGRLRAEPVSWDRDAEFALPVDTWRSTMDLYFPNSGWMRVSRDDPRRRLRGSRRSRGLPTWDHALEQLFKEAGEPW